MAPISLVVDGLVARRSTTAKWQELSKRGTGAATFGNWRDVNHVEAYIVEAWGQGFMFGALLIMSLITVANMKKGVLLHKLILLEVGVRRKQEWAQS